MTLLLLTLLIGALAYIVVNSDTPAGERARALIDALIERIRPKRED